MTGSRNNAILKSLNIIEVFLNYIVPL
jgi:hypothetical protein